MFWIEAFEKLQMIEQKHVSNTLYGIFIIKVKSVIISFPVVEIKQVKNNRNINSITIKKKILIFLNL